MSSESDVVARRIGANIKTAREAAGLTRADLAVRCRTTQPIVSRWESGDRGLSVGALLAVAGALLVPAGVLLGEVGDPGDAQYAAGHRDGWLACARATADAARHPGAPCRAAGGPQAAADSPRGAS